MPGAGGAARAGPDAAPAGADAPAGPEARATVGDGLAAAFGDGPAAVAGACAAGGVAQPASSAAHSGASRHSGIDGVVAVEGGLGRCDIAGSGLGGRWPKARTLAQMRHPAPPCDEARSGADEAQPPQRGTWAILRRVQFIDAATTRRRLAFAPLIDALRLMFVAGCEVPLRHTHRIGDAQQPGATAGTVLLMPAWQPGRHLGIKTVTVFPGNGARGKPGLHSMYTLFDAATGEPLAQMDGDEITARRTAAASALAASFLARPDASHLLVVGAGRVGSLMAEAHAAARPIRRVSVWSRRAEAARALAVRLAAQGFEAEARTDLQAAVREADVISCATLATAPLVQGDWLQPGAHLDLIGSFSPEMRETDAACFARSRVFVDTHEALAKSGDVLQAMAEGAFSAERLQGDLAALCRGDHRGRDSDREITLFKSVGTALEDLAAAQLVIGDGA